MSKSVFVLEKNVLSYIKNILLNCQDKEMVVRNAKYHHNTNYYNASSVCKNGILTLTDLDKFGIKKFSNEFLLKMDDFESHINGINAVSLSVVGLDDLYYNEDEYNPLSPYQVDFLITSDIPAGRTTINYGNEFLSYRSIPIDKIKSVDIRLLKLIELTEKYSYTEYYTIKKVVDNYNCLKGIALAIKQNDLDIPLREMSFKSIGLNKDKLLDTPKLVLKKK